MSVKGLDDTIQRYDEHAEQYAKADSGCSDKLSGHERFFQYFTAPELTGLLEKSQFSLISAKEYNEL